MKVENLKFQSHNALSIVQFETESKNSFEYISLSNAIKNKHITVGEISESGSVNDLKVVNDSKHFVFMSDGDILSGAKQNRVLNTSILIAPKTRVIIPVSCIEQGRWRYRSDNFDSTDDYAPSHLRCMINSDVSYNLKSTSMHKASQSNIWNSVSDYVRNFNVSTDSSNLSDVFDSRKDHFNEYLNEFKVDNGSNGIAVFHNKRMINIEIFNRTDVYEEYFKKLIKSVYFDFQMSDGKDYSISKSEAFKIINDFLINTDTLRYEEYNGAGTGIEKRFETNEMSGFELNYENKLIHFVTLRNQGNGDLNRGKKIYVNSRGELVINFGKYKGQSVERILRQEPGYINWICLESDLEYEYKSMVLDYVTRR